MNRNHTQSYASRRARVLVALKRVSHASALLGHAKTLVADGAKVWVVHVLERSPDATDASLTERLDVAEESVRQSLAGARLGGAASPLVVVGAPAEEILGAAQAVDAEIVLLGAGDPAAGTTPTGSGVGLAVLAGAQCPVVVYDLRADRPIKAP